LLEVSPETAITQGFGTVLVQLIRLADNPGVDIATSGLSQVDGAENGAGKRWV